MKKIFYSILFILLLLFMPNNIKALTNSVASIDDVEYETLVDAFENVVEGNTINILSDIDMTEMDSLVANLPSNVTINLNWHTITIKYMGLIFTGDNLTIKNGSFQSKADYALWVGDEKESVGITVENVETIGGVNVYNATNVVLRNVNATGRTYYAVWADSVSEVIVESGNYSTLGSAGLVGATNKTDIEVPLTIKGGNFITNNGKLNPVGADLLDPVILGGNYNTDVTNYLIDGYECNLIDDTYVVSKIKYEQDVDITTIDPNEEVTEPTIGVSDAENTEKVLLDSLNSTDIDIENKNIKIVTDIKKIDVDEETENQINEALTNQTENAIISNYFDITLNVIDTDLNSIIGSLTNLNSKIKFTVALPTELVKVPIGYTRNYYIIKKHNDNIVITTASLSDDDKFLTFETDEFSTYALAYEDVKNEGIDVPETYDGISTYLAFGTISIIALATTIIYIKKKKLFS